MSRPLTIARKHRQVTTDLTSDTYKRLLAQWNSVDENAILDSWNEQLPHAAATVGQAQTLAAIDSTAYAETVLDAQDLDIDGPTIEARAFAGTMQASGARVEAALAGVAYHSLDRIGEGMPPAQALTAGRRDLSRLIQTSIIQVATAATGAFALTRTKPTTGYVRVVHASGCDRCAILAGRFYRWNAGFNRHPHCRCEHLPTTRPRSDELTTDPYDHFNNLSEDDQDRIYTKAGAQAIRDGADIYQVVNARRQGALTPSGRFTREGMGKRGYYRTHTGYGQAGRRRLSVDEIYRRANGSPDRARKLLADYGYLTDQGQIAGGVIRGNVEGYGQFGRGGTRIGATAEVIRARRTGVRNPNSQYTMTAAELREHRRKIYAAA